MPNQSTVNAIQVKEEDKKPDQQTWFVYLLRCSDNSLYAGVTTDLKRREKEHNGKSKRGAKYTRVRQPVELVYFEQVDDRVAATKREYQIRKLTKKQKESLVANFTITAITT